MRGKRREFEVLKHRDIYRGRAVHLAVDRVRLPNGHELEREIIYHPGSAVMVPISGPNKIVLIRQFRYSTGGFIWEFPAGTVDRGESPFACAKRELIEETGYSARIWKKLRTFYPTPGVSTELMHLYLAEGLTPSAARPEFDEFIETRFFSMREISKMIKTGKVKDGKTILAYYELLNS